MNAPLSHTFWHSSASEKLGWHSQESALTCWILDLFLNQADGFGDVFVFEGIPKAALKSQNPPHQM